MERSAPYLFSYAVYSVYSKRSPYLVYKDYMSNTRQLTRSAATASLIIGAPTVRLFPTVHWSRATRVCALSQHQEAFRLLSLALQFKSEVCDLI